MHLCWLKLQIWILYVAVITIIIVASTFQKRKKSYALAKIPHCSLGIKCVHHINDTSLCGPVQCISGQRFEKAGEFLKKGRRDDAMEESSLSRRNRVYGNPVRIRKGTVPVTC